MHIGPGSDDEAFDNSGQAHEADIDELYDTQETEVDEEGEE